MSKWSSGGGSLEGTFATVDLPASGTAADIDLSAKPTVHTVNAVLSASGYAAYGATAAAALAALASNATRQLLPAGAYSFQVAGNDGHLAFASAGSAATDGLSYHLVEG